MDQKLNFESRLPPGFRFHPTDEELVVQYLKRKVLSYPLPAASVIPEVDVGRSDPWDLPGDPSEQERYFFRTRESKYPNGNRWNRATASGYWKATGLDKQIMSHHHHHQIVGMKKTLVFYKGKPPKGVRTDWIMHEYRLINNNAVSNKSANEDWVLCRIFLKKRGVRVYKGENNHHEDTWRITNSSGLVFYDFMVKESSSRADLNRVPDSSCSASSGITEISISYKDGTSESSSCNSFISTTSVTRK